MSKLLLQNSPVYAIGFLAQVLFSARLIIQWIKSERAQKVITPEIYWQLSLIASMLLFIYGLLRDDFAIILGQSLTYLIYMRNMQFQGTWTKVPLLFKILFLATPVLIILYMLLNWSQEYILLFMQPTIPPLLVFWGSVGQVIFTARFIYQWIYSEKIKESILPKGFWILSLTGSAMIISYAIFRKDPVLFVGHVFGALIYARNIFLYRKMEIIS